ncbi:hypothetical protein ABBQ32_012694 [Trebouxia sp. C0010 RCD-2024]
MVPPAYTITLDADPGTFRDTDGPRLKPAAVLQDMYADCDWSVCPAPRCQSIITAGQLQDLAKADFEQYCTAANDASLRLMGIIGCPSCGALIERLAPTSQSAAASEVSALQSGVTYEAAMHQAVHRYRCAACRQDFCGECCVTPYHSGLTCHQQRAPKCLYCRTPLLDDPHFIIETASSGQLRQAIKALKADCSWCLEKQDLIHLLHRLHQVCKGKECQLKLSQSCVKQLACGHWCGGVAGELSCLPCLHGCLTAVGSGNACQRSVTLDGQDACPMCWEALACAPAIMLSCNHTCHLECAREHLRQGYPGPAISFTFLLCPSCGEGGGHRHGNVQISSSAPPMQHPALIDSLKVPLELREQTVQLAKRRLKMEGLHTRPELKPGGLFDGRPADFALTKLLFFECDTCSRPYYGGQRQCGADGAPNDGGHAANVGDRKELICGACSAHEAGSKCQQHGVDFIEWKCRYCCGIASFFCFGTTHMCTACHEEWQLNPGCKKASRHLCTPVTCPLHVRHPDHGLEHCLGCAICRTHE